MKTPLVLVAAALILGGCSTMQLQNASDLAARLNAGIASIDQVAHQFCPTLQAAGTSVTTIACVARANGTQPRAVSAAVAWGRRFCANPASTGLADLAGNIASGVVAIVAARDAGCTGGGP